MKRNLILIAVLSLALVVPATAQFTRDVRLNGFQPMDDYLLELDGVEVRGAKLFNQPAPAILIMASDLPAPVVLWPRTGLVETVNLLKVSSNTNGSIDILPNPLLGRHGSFELFDGKVDNVVVRFEIEGRQAALKLKPALVGLKSTGELREYSATYAQRADFYEPADALLEVLRAEANGVRVRVFFGTWCPACGQMVPRVMKVAEKLEGAEIEFEFYGLPRDIHSDAQAEDHEVKSVPTGVVFVDDREVGRINGNDWRVPEAALTTLLNKSS